jgi:hypothetical protein
VTLAPLAIAVPPAASIAKVVHHHSGAAPRKLKRVGAAKPAAGAGDDRNPSFETNGHR